jgi:hypothetical protein
MRPRVPPQATHQVAAAPVRGVVPPHNQTRGVVPPHNQTSRGVQGGRPPAQLNRGVVPPHSQNEETPRELWLAPPPSRGSSALRCGDSLPSRTQPGRAKDLAIPHVTAGPDTEAPSVPSDRWAGSGVPTRRPSLSYQPQRPFASHPPPKRKLQTPPRTRLVRRFPDPPDESFPTHPWCGTSTTFVSGPLDPLRDR